MLHPPLPMPPNPVYTVTVLYRTVTVDTRKRGKVMENTAVISCAPRSVNVTVRKPSSRPREYLTEREVEKLIDTAGKNRWGHRDATAILVAYRHGLRASEVVSLG